MINPYTGQEMIFVNGNWCYLLNGKVYYRVSLLNLDLE